jgi:hypothetical protein
MDIFLDTNLEMKRQILKYLFVSVGKFSPIFVNSDGVEKSTEFLINNVIFRLIEYRNTVISSSNRSNPLFCVYDLRTAIDHDWYNAESLIYSQEELSKLFSEVETHQTNVERTKILYNRIFNQRIENE